MVESSPAVIVALIVTSLVIACLFAFCHAQFSKKRRASRMRKHMDEDTEAVCRNQEIPFPFNKRSQAFQPQRFLIGSETSGFDTSVHSIPVTLKTSHKTINKYEHVLKASTLTKVSNRVYSPRTSNRPRRSTSRRPSSSLTKSVSSGSKQNIYRGSNTLRPTRSRPASAKPSIYRPRQIDNNLQCNSTLPKSILKPEIPFAKVVVMPFEREASRKYGQMMTG